MPAAARPSASGFGQDLVELRASLRAMGSTISLAVRVPRSDAEAARQVLAAEAAWFQEVERRLTRFDPESELSRLNRLAGQWCVVSPLLYAALSAAARAHRLTGGLFDPSILPALERWGYDRDFREMPGRIRPGDPAFQAPVPESPSPRLVAPGGSGFAPRALPLTLDPVARAVRLEQGARLDLGGIVKGLAADSSLRRLASRFPAALVDAGGDIAGLAKDGMPPWRIALPMRGPGLPHALRVRRGGVATSATARRWVGPPGRAHHLIDPRTQAPADSGLEMVTVVARWAATAEVLAKALLIGGPDATPYLLGQVPPAEAFWRTGCGKVGTYRCPSG